MMVVVVVLLLRVVEVEVVVVVVVVVVVSYGGNIDIDLIGNFCIAVLFEKFQVVRFNLRAALE
jgi:hypothetical protein